MEEVSCKETLFHWSTDLQPRTGTNGTEKIVVLI